jgi:ferric-dicitrate binding protein FerR (iron transport regulator)
MALAIVSVFSLSPAALRSQGSNAPPSRAARLSYLYGRVSFLPSGDTTWVDATLNYTVTTGDRLYTDQGSRTELEVGPAGLRLAAETDVTVTNLTDQLIQLGLTQGTVRLSVYDLLPGDSIELDTPNGALTLLRAGNYRVEVRPNDDATLVTVDDGRWK